MEVESAAKTSNLVDSAMLLRKPVLPGSSLRLNFCTQSLSLLQRDIPLQKPSIFQLKSVLLGEVCIYRGYPCIITEAPPLAASAFHAQKFLSAGT